MDSVKLRVNRVRAFDAWINSRILKISWTNRTPNVDVSERTNLEVVKTVKMQNFQYTGRVMRHMKKYSLLQLILQGRNSWENNARRMCWMDDLGRWLNVVYEFTKLSGRR